jgi:hypothetical protein
VHLVDVTCWAEALGVFKGGSWRERLTVAPTAARTNRSGAGRPTLD